MEQTSFITTKCETQSGKKNLLSQSILGLQPRDKAAMLGVKTKEYFLE